MKALGKKQTGGLVALGVAVALLGGGAADPAHAAARPAEDAPTTGHGFDQLAQQFGADGAVHGIGQNGRGDVIITADVDALKESTKAELKKYDNIEVKNSSSLHAQAASDIVGGAGYFAHTPGSPFIGFCSFGFSAWTPTGGPAVISAGHCGSAGDEVYRTQPSQDDAPKYPAAPVYNQSQMDGGAQIGVFAFSQFGGPGSTAGAQSSNTSIDISAIDITSAAVTPKPFVTDWSSAATDDLSTSGTKVTAVGTAAPNDAIVRSGRTTGSHSGQVLETGWYDIVDSNGNDHWVKGFLTNAVSDHGDSGGAYLRGTTAVGVLSGGGTVNGQQVSVGTDLLNALSQTGGYTIMLDIAAPVVTSPADGAHVQPGQTITGTGPAGLTLNVTLNGTVTPVAIDGSGNWSFTAPSAPGAANYSLQVVDGGYNHSTSVTFGVIVDKLAVKAPIITSPASAATVTGPAVTVTGTGNPGATITLSGGVSGTTTVDGSGNWSLAVTAPYGPVDVTATQTQGTDTQTVSGSFTVSPTAPTVTSPAHGAVLTASPSVISGSGVPGATVTVSLDGSSLGTATVGADGTWSVTVGRVLPIGGYHLAVTQTVDGVSSAAAKSDFALVLASSPSPNSPAGGGDAPAASGGNSLAMTGLSAEATLATGIIGGVLVLLAGAALLVARRLRRNDTAA